LSEGSLWNSNQSPSGFEAGRFEDPHRQQFNGTGPERVDHFLGPGPDDKADMYRAGYPARDGIPPAGMLANSMSPDAMSAGKTTCNTYFPSYNKRQLEDSPRGRSGDKFTDSTKRRKNSNLTGLAVITWPSACYRITVGGRMLNGICGSRACNRHRVRPALACPYEARLCTEPSQSYFLACPYVARLCTEPSQS
ncbi:hypothetical protein RRG08_010427, partial [Elysia crispata]